VGGFGTAPYLGGDPATSPAPLAGVVARYVVERSALVLDPELARPDRARWFLWQGLPLADPGVESVLVELHAVANAEVPTAVPRPPTQTVAAVDGEAALVIQALDAVLGS